MKATGRLDASLCMQCQVCGAACTAAPVNGLRPRDVVLRAAAGDPDLHRGPEPWMCVTCYACSEQCRAGVDIPGLFYGLRNRAAAEGRIPAPYRAVARQVLGTGCAFPVTGLTGKMRAELGLAPFAVAPRDVEELDALCRAEGLPDPDAPDPAAKEA